METLIYKVFLFLFIIECVMCQVCEETRSVFREVPETFRFSYIETYEEPCIIFCSVKTRQSVNITTRMVQRYENVTVSICCDGYVEDDQHEGNGLYCEPICDPPCENGYCRKPNQCTCDPGYAPDPVNPYICKPLCLEGCQIPTCITTRTPQCSSNTSSAAVSDRPFCAEPCINGVCIEPGICRCLPGYRSTSANNCEPDFPSSYSCEHGTFISPDTCLCDLGWEWKCGSCHPVCNDCTHGTCVSPGECQCDDGYVKNDKGQCELQNTNVCVDGNCVNSEVCCAPGWYKATEDGECQPHCDMNCNHGDCIAPNICDCHAGYQLYINSKGRSRCLVNRKNCTDSSSDPETCECHAPYQVSYFRDDGSNCLCVGACADESTKCTNATCLFMNVSPDTDNPELDELDYDYLIDSEAEDYDDSPETTTEHNENGDVTTQRESKEKNWDMLMTLLPSFGRDEIPENVEDIQTTIPSVPIIKQEDDVPTALNSENIRKKRETIKSPLYWIIGSIVFGATIIFIVLGFVVKRKCFKTQISNAKDSQIKELRRNKQKKEKEKQPN